MKTREIMMIVFLSLAALLFSCSKEDPSVDPPDNQEEEWDKNRTLEITIISDLSGRNTFPQDGLTDVASAVKENKSHLLLLDGVVVNRTAPVRHPGAEVAVQAGKVPLFVPVSVSEESYNGTVLFYDRPVSQVQLTEITEDCYYLQEDVTIMPGLTVKTAVVSFDSEEQVNASGKVLKSLLPATTLVTGTMKKEYFDLLPEVLSEAGMDEDEYELRLIEQSKEKPYVIFAIGSKRWKFRNSSGTTLQDTMKSFLLEIEFLK